MQVIRHIIEWLKSKLRSLFGSTEKKIITGAVAILVSVPLTTAPVFPPESLTVQEYQEVVEMYDTEIQKLGGVELQVADGDILKALSAKIREGEVSERTEELLSRLENTSLLDKITQ